MRRRSTSSLSPAHDATVNCGAVGRSRRAPLRRPPTRSAIRSARPSGWTPRRRSSPAPVARGPCPPNRPPRRSGPSPSSSSIVVSPSASRPTTCRPASAQLFSVRVRFVARETGSRAAAPALVRHATAVTDADRRCGMSTPWPPNAATERTIAPRLRGSEMLSNATSSAGTLSVVADRPADRRGARTRTAAPAARCPGAARCAAIRSRSCRGTSRIEMPESAAQYD